MSDPWSKPPFWAKGPSPADVRRRQFLELGRARDRLRRLDAKHPNWLKVYERVRALEADLGLSPTRSGYGMRDAEDQLALQAFADEASTQVVEEDDGDV